MKVRGDGVVVGGSPPDSQNSRKRAERRIWLGGPIKYRGDLVGHGQYIDWRGPNI